MRCRELQAGRIAKVMEISAESTSPYLQPQRLDSAYCQQAWHRLLC